METTSAVRTVFALIVPPAARRCGQDRRRSSRCPHIWGLIDGILILVNGGVDGQGRPLRD
ncbi:hypothetical protein DKT69_27275 [Micromonospora sicca]|uniref:Uncharacterized protein n=1 Tax=Micromonospora sicca TaxID=2202420 RepID=A0A317DA32_9ACTN|nr:hypothetical protein [Micromonospora sp. ATA51]PWR11172.1 hypothetical protein DKT69_27275 [Micromonospora sp. 4G51]